MNSTTKLSDRNSDHSIIIVDYGLGNLYSIAKALNYIGVQPEISDEPDKILKADKLILPGVGAFGDGINGIKKRGLVWAIKEYAKSGKHLLAICLGMHLLMSEGEEFGTYEGLDIIQGRVVSLRSLEQKKFSYKLPHIGWNNLLQQKNLVYKISSNENQRQSVWQRTILEDLADGVFVYFAHSNIVFCDNLSYCLAETIYGNIKFWSVIRKGNIYGCQFHPEKSGEEGLKILKKFVFA